MVPPPSPDFADVCARLGVHDPVAVFHAIRHIIREVYAANAERHDESMGDDLSTFGYLVYRNSWFQLEHELPRLDPMLDASRPGNSLSVSTGGPRLKFYRGGSDETFELEAWDLDHGSDAKCSMRSNNDRQLRLFEALGDPRSQAPRSPLELGEWAVVHAGNPHDGLTSVWVGAPRRPPAAGDSPWAFVHQLPDLCHQRRCVHDLTPSGKRPARQPSLSLL